MKAGEFLAECLFWLLILAASVVFLWEILALAFDARRDDAPPAEPEPEPYEQLPASEKEWLRRFFK